MNILLSRMFWHSFGLAFCILCHATCFTVSKCESFDVFCWRTYILLHMMHFLADLSKYLNMLREMDLKFEMDGIQVLLKIDFSK